MGRIDWSEALDLGRAAANVRTEFVGDWHNDPWGWPELGFLEDRATDTVVSLLDSTGARRVGLVDVPKENWGSRPAVVLDIADRLIYQALVDRLSVDLIGDMTDSAFGWRLPPTNPVRGVYSHNSLQWNAYRSRLTFSAAQRQVALTTDLVSFFASIPLELVQDTVADRAGSSLVTSRLLHLLDGLDRIPERSGLPQRSLASAVLANAVVEPLDDVLAHHATPLPFEAGKSSSREQMSAARWMDDMWLFTDEVALARRAQAELQAVAHSLGLHLNSAKTEVYEGDQVWAEAMQIQHSAIDQALDRNSDTTPLEELLDRLIQAPEKASRTSIKFTVKRMRDRGVRYRIDDLVELAPRMPHVADALAPLFRESFTAPSLQEWFLDYARSDWAAFPWSVAQYSHMFTSGRSPQKGTREFFADVVQAPDTSLPLLAVAAQRLAAWDAGEARAAIRAAMSRASNPQARRILALSALGAGESRASVRRWLGQEEENRVTLDMLEAFGFGSPKLVAHFTG